MVSAGDHERMPDRDAKKFEDGEEIDLTKSDGKFKKAKIDPKYLKALRKGIKNPGKWNMFGEKDDDKITVSNPASKSPVKPSSTGIAGTDMTQMLNAARQAKIDGKSGNIKSNGKIG